MENKFYLDFMRRPLVVVHGKHDTRPDGEYDTTTLADIWDSVDAPQTVPKLEADGFLASTHNSRSDEAQREHGEFALLRVDVDSGNHALEEVAWAVGQFVPPECAVLIHSTPSSKPDDRTWRVLVPTEPMRHETWHLAQRAINEAVGDAGINADTAMERANQYTVGPVRGEHYEYLRQHGEAFDLVTLGERMTALSKRDAALAQVAAQPRARAGGHKEFIDAFNAQADTANLLVEAGFETRNGRDWWHPEQTTKSYATRLFDNGRCVTQSETVRGFGIGAGNYFDALDLVVFTKYDGDMSAAIEAESKTLMVMSDPESGEMVSWHNKTHMDFLNKRRREQQQLENAELQEAGEVRLKSVMSLDEMLEDCVLIGDGSRVTFLSEPRIDLALGDFINLMKPSVTTVPKGDGSVKNIPTTHLWLNHPKRKSTEKRTFAPGKGPFCRDPLGASAVNTCKLPERRPVDVAIAQLFIDHVHYLMPDDAPAFLDYLAHIEQRPDVLPHFGWLHISAKTGTGRNWVASVLARVWRGLVAPNVDLPALLNGQFNGQLAGRVLAMVDEIREGGGDSYGNAEKLKSLVNQDTRLINPKFGRQSLEFNVCRWLVFSNHANALPLGDDDRRWRVVAVDVNQRGVEVYEQLYAALNNPLFIEAVAWFLKTRDISKFRPGERPPLNKAKQLVIGASRSVLRDMADDLVKSDHLPDLISNRDAAMFLSDGKEVTLSLAMRRVLEDAGARQLLNAETGAPAALRLTTTKLSKYWVLRNFSTWSDATPSALKTEANRVPKVKADTEVFMPDEQV